MSTRSGEFTTLREVLDEVGVDAARFFYLLRSFHTHLDSTSPWRRPSRGTTRCITSSTCTPGSAPFSRGGSPGKNRRRTPPLSILTFPEEVRLMKAVARFPTSSPSARRRSSPTDPLLSHRSFRSLSRLLPSAPGSSGSRRADAGTPRARPCVKTVVASGFPDRP